MSDTNNSPFFPAFPATPFQLPYFCRRPNSKPNHLPPPADADQEIRKLFSSPRPGNNDFFHYLNKSLRFHYIKYINFAEKPKLPPADAD